MSLPDTSQPLLAIRNLTAGYKKPVVSGISLTCGRGIFAALLGANGSGKTTFLRTVSKHLKALAGEIFIEGRELKTIKPAALAKMMSVVLTDRSSVPMLRVLEFAALGRHPHSGFLGRLSQADTAAVEQALAAVQAEDLAERYIDELSDGERQKAVLARALAQDPRLMLLDEPTAHLDLKHRLEVLSILRRLCRQRNLTVVAAVHDVEAAAKTADLVITFKDGRMQDFGVPEEILTPEAVRDLYDCPQANYDSRLGSLETASDGRAGRAFVLGGQDSAALACRLLAKKGYRLTAGFFQDTDLDAHVARSLGARLLAWKSGEKPDEDLLLRESLKELAQCSLLVLGEDHLACPGVRAQVLEAAREQGLPVLAAGPGGLAAGLPAALDNLNNPPDPGRTQP
jgi:iron complex transport system ATP-binding protein